MVMVHPGLKPTACWEFTGGILVHHHPTTISPKHQAMGDFEVLMTAASVVSIEMVLAGCIIIIGL